MIDKADIVDNDTKNITTYEDLIPQKNISFNKKSFNVFKSFKNKQKSCEISKKLEEDNKIVNNIMNIQKKYSSKYVFPKGIYYNRFERKRVSIANANEL